MHGGVVLVDRCVHMGRVVGVCFVGVCGGGGLFPGVLALEQRPLESNPLSVESVGRAFLTEVKALRLGPPCLWAGAAKLGK